MRARPYIRRYALQSVGAMNAAKFPTKCRLVRSMMKNFGMYLFLFFWMRSPYSRTRKSPSISSGPMTRMVGFISPWSPVV